MASYRLVSDDDSWPLAPGENLIGRYSHCQVVLEAEGVAGEHARVDVAAPRRPDNGVDPTGPPADGRPAGNELTVTDLGTPDGTFLDGARVVPEPEGGAVPLRVGQTIRVGSVELRVEGLPDLSRRLVSLTSRRRVRAAAKIGAGLVVAFVLLLVVLRLVYNAERLRRDIVETIESGLGRDVEIASIDYGYFAGRTELRGLVVRNLPESGTEPFLQAAGVVIRFREGGFYTILGKKLKADVTLHQPVVFVQRDEHGRWNVADLVRAFARCVRGGGEGFRRRLPYSVLEMHLSARDATVRVRDDLTNRSEEITGVTFEADLPGLGEPLTYDIKMKLPVAGRPGRVWARGEFRLFAGREIHDGSVQGEILRLAVEGLDLRAVPGMPGAARGGTLDLDCVLGAAGFRSVEIEAHGRLVGAGAVRQAHDARVLSRSKGVGGAGGDGSGNDVTFRAELSGDLLAPTLEAGEVSFRGRDWELSSQGRVVPAVDPAANGAQVLDLDTTLRARLDALARACGVTEVVDTRMLAGDVEIRFSTTGSTKELDVRADASVSGLHSPRSFAPPEDATASFRGTVGLAGWSSVDSVKVSSLSARASFLDAALGPGSVEGLAHARHASARLGPLEFDLDLDELVRRYGPALSAKLPRVRLHGWVSANGEEGRIEVRHAAEMHDMDLRRPHMWSQDVRSGPRLEGVATVEFADAGPESIELDEELGGEGGIAGTLSGSVGLAGPEPEFKVSLTSSGELSRVLDLARPYLGQIGSVWARGKFDLDARMAGTPGRFSTRGGIELLGPELWGGPPTTLPFSEPRIDVIWNIECDRTGGPVGSAVLSGRRGPVGSAVLSGRRGPVRLKANVLKATSSTLRLKLEGEVEDLRRWLGRYDLRAFVDFDRIGTVLKKLGLLPSVADLRGTMDVDLGADTREGRLELRSFSVDTPFLEARGGGEIFNVPFEALYGHGSAAEAAEAAEEMSGSIELGATLDVEGVEALVNALTGRRAGEASRRPERVVEPTVSREPTVEGRGEVRLSLRAEGSGRELVLKGELDLDRFAGRLGRYVSKSLDELASLRFSATAATGRPEVFRLRSGVLTLGGAEDPARLEIQGGLARALDRFEVVVRSERFPVRPLAALAPELAPGAGGAAALDLRVRGKLRDARLVPGSLELDGRAELHDAEIAWRKMDGLRGRFDGSVRLSGREIRADGLRISLLARAPEERAGRAARFEEAGVLEFEELGFTRDIDLGAPSGAFRARAKTLDLGSVLAAASRGPAGEPDAGRAPAASSGPHGRPDRAASSGPHGRPDRAASDVVRTVVSLLGFRAEGSLTAGKVELWTGGPDLTDLRANASVGPAGIELKDLECAVWGGMAEGEASLDYSGGRLASGGELSAEDMDMKQIAASAGVRGALSGRARARVHWAGRGFTRGDLERSWEIELDGGTGEFSMDPGLWPIAREVSDAVELLLGVGSPSGEVKCRPVTVRVLMRRGRLGMEEAELEIDSGLRLALSGRAELDGRIAGWVTVDGLPREVTAPSGQHRRPDRAAPSGQHRRPDRAAPSGQHRRPDRAAPSGPPQDATSLDGGPDAVQRATLSELVDRGLLRFGVTGTWGAPLADVRGLLWMLLDTPAGEGPERGPGQQEEIEAAPSGQHRRPDLERLHEKPEGPAEGQSDGQREPENSAAAAE